MPVTHFVISREHQLLEDYCPSIAADQNYLTVMNELTGIASRVIAMVGEFKSQPRIDSEDRDVIDALMSLLKACDNTAGKIAISHTEVHVS